MNKSSLVNIIQTYSYLQKAVHESLGIEIFIFITEKSLKE